MATLSQTTQATRKLLKWAGIGFVAFLLIRFLLFPIGQLTYNLIFPKKPPPPVEGFGKLPHIPFPKGENGGGLTYSINTTTGGLPKNIPDRIQVFQASLNQASFSSYDRTKQKAAKIGFSGEGTPLSQTMYQWKDPKIDGRQIVFNTVTQDFTLTANLTSSSEFALPTKDQATQIANTFLKNISLLPKDIDDTKTKISFVKLQNGGLALTTSLSESNFIQVDFYRKPLSDLPIVYPDPNHSLISFLVEGGRETNTQVALAYFSYKNIDEKNTSTYPIKTAVEAFEELKTGKAYIALLPTQKAISITKIYLAYYEGNDDTNFFLPVFVFEGDGFFSFLEAVKEQSLQ